MSEENKSGWTVDGLREYFKLWNERIEEAIKAKNDHDKELRESDSKARDIALVSLKEATATTKMAQDQYNNLHNDLQRKGEKDRAEFARKDDVDMKLEKVEVGLNDKIIKADIRIQSLEMALYRGEGNKTGVTTTWASVIAILGLLSGGGIVAVLIKVLSR